MGTRSQVLTARRRCFTFIEVVVAALILSMSLGLVLSIFGMARARILRAERRWAREHALGQAVEFYLLAGSDGAVPNDLLPEGFSCQCELVLAEDLPDAALDPIQQWVLGEFRVKVFNSFGDLLGERRVQKIVKQEDCR